MFRIVLIIALLGWAAPAMAASPNFLGSLGLNIVPSARMDQSGTIRAGVSTVDPYENAYISVQPADWLNITLRQSAKISSLTDDPKALYPGVD